MRKHRTTHAFIGYKIVSRYLKSKNHIVSLKFLGLKADISYIDDYPSWKPSFSSVISQLSMLDYQRVNLIK
jgi:hypothetical protein